MNTDERLICTLPNYVQNKVIHSYKQGMVTHRTNVLELKVALVRSH